jgi:hypothetical protein
MKIYNYLLAAGISSICLLPASAQVVSKQVTDKYPASVITRVYEVTKASSLSPDKQLSLAAFYVRKDSMIAGMLQRNTSPGEIDLVQSALEQEFNELLNSRERLKYKVSVNSEFIEKDARAIASYMARKYGAKADLELILYKLILEKNNGLLRVMHTTIDSNDTRKQEQFVLSRFDSIYNDYMVAVKGEPYFKQQVDRLTAIKPLTEKEFTILRNNYLNGCLKKGDNYYKNFHTALLFASDNKDYYQLLYKDSIENEVAKKSKQELNDLLYKYGLHDTLLRKIDPILADKTRKITELEATMVFNSTRDSLIRNVEASAWAQVKKIMIRAGYYRLSNSRFVNAMRYEKILNLSSAQLDSLAEKNYRLDILEYVTKSIDPWNEYDPKYFTNANMEKIFTPGQYDTLLKIESRPLAMSNTYRDWNALKNYKLTEGLDSATTSLSIFTYHMSNLILTRRYEHDKVTLNRLMKANAAYKPAALVKLEAIMKQEDWNSKESAKAFTH